MFAQLLVWPVVLVGVAWGALALWFDGPAERWGRSSRSGEGAHLLARMSDPIPQLHLNFEFRISNFEIDLSPRQPVRTHKQIELR